MKLTAAYILRLLKSPALYIGVAGCALIALWGIISAGNFTSVRAIYQIYGNCPAFQRYDGFRNIPQAYSYCCLHAVYSRFLH